jgi:transcriptional regulator with XRE-family HTH domain
MLYPANPQTVGDRLKKRRDEHGLYQKDAAALLGVNQSTLIGWEKGRKDPAIQIWPRAIKFLGYDPHGEPRMLGKRFLAARRRLGITQEQAAKLASVDEESFRLWELGKRKPSPTSLMKIEEFFTMNS